MDNPDGGLLATSFNIKSRRQHTIAAKLVLSFLIMILLISGTFTGVVIALVSHHIESDLKGRVQEDLARARVLYLDRLNQINNVVRSTALRTSVKEAVVLGDFQQLEDELVGIRILESIDFLTLVDTQGNVVVRAGHSETIEDDNTQGELVATAMKFQMPAAASTIVGLDALRRESTQLADKLVFDLEGTSDQTNIDEKYSQGGIVLAAAAPIFDSSNKVVGAVYGGQLINNNQDFVCEIKQDIYRNSLYNDLDVGFVSIYQGNQGILTCPYGIREPNSDGYQIDDASFAQVALATKPWISEELLMGSSYVTASQPIWDPDFETIGVLQVGTIKQKYLDVRDQIVVAFISIMLIGSFVSILFGYIISRQISIPIRHLVGASRKLAAGDLNAHVDTSSMPDNELVELANSFNTMSSALSERDQKLRELSRYRIKRSERLALIGKLAANVAHEINNPLQGIVTYSHLMLEEMPDDDPHQNFVQIIVTQANRCREIVRGLLDFSRQREPDKRLCDVNVILQDCIMLLINQALFLNIEIDSDIDVDLPLVVADPSQLERVFVNIMVNAAEAMDGHGRLTLTTRRNSSQKAIEVLISDTGHGIAREDLKRIFDPFYTTKEVGKGTGLGLAISYGITMEHGGELSVESEVGKGTTFTMCLPIGDDIRE